MFFATVARHGRRYVLALALWAAGSAPAWAQNFYTVDDVAVDVTAEAAATAQQRALVEAQRIAYDRLMRRLVGPDAISRVPPADDSRLQALVQGIEVNEEKRSSTRYIAKLTVAFRPDPVRNLLRGLGIPFNDQRGRPVLLVPVYTVAGATLLWDDPNPWREAWAGIDSRDRLQPLVVPKGDLVDIGAIGAEQALAGDSVGLTTLARRYGAGEILLAHAVLRSDVGGAQALLDVTLRRIGQGPERTSVETFTGANRDEIEPLLVNAARQLAGRVETDWRRDSRLTTGAAGRLSVRVPLGSLSDWVGLRDRLSAVQALTRIELSRLTTGAAQVVLHHLGDVPTLVTLLAQRDLDLVERDGFWSLSLRPGASASAAPPPSAPDTPGARSEPEKTE
jgi:hypothetical protein